MIWKCDSSDYRKVFVWYTPSKSFPHKIPRWAMILSKKWSFPSTWYLKRCCLISSVIDWLNFVLKLSREGGLEELLALLSKIIICSRNLKVTQFLSIMPTVPFILTIPKAFSSSVSGFSWSECSKGCACIHTWFTNSQCKIIWKIFVGTFLQRGHGLFALCHLLYEYCV